MNWDFVLPRVEITDTVQASEPAMNSEQTSERFAAFYQRSARPLWAYLARVSGDPSLADDLMQESYVRFLCASSPCDGEVESRRYLFRIASNLLRDHWRAAQAPRRSTTSPKIYSSRPMHAARSIHGPSSPSWKRTDDNEGIEPALIVDDHQLVDQQRRENKAKAEPVERLIHALYLAAHDDLCTERQNLALFHHDAIALCRDRAKIVVLRVGIDIEDRRAVVVVDDHWHDCGRQRRHIAQYFGTIAERPDRNGRILEHIDGVDAVLRRLRSHGISKAHLWIEPEVRLHCRTGTQRNVRLFATSCSVRPNCAARTRSMSR
jgi:DNA-directed RNA polymerase specialized sigma24 family protein